MRSRVLSEGQVRSPYEEMPVYDEEEKNNGITNDDIGFVILVISNRQGGRELMLLFCRNSRRGTNREVVVGLGSVSKSTLIVC